MRRLLVLCASHIPKGVHQRAAWFDIMAQSLHRSIQEATRHGIEVHVRILYSQHVEATPPSTLETLRHYDVIVDIPGRQFEKYRAYTLDPSWAEDRARTLTPDTWVVFTDDDDAWSESFLRAVGEATTCPAVRASQMFEFGSPVRMEHVDSLDAMDRVAYQFAKVAHKHVAEKSREAARRVGPRAWVTINDTVYWNVVVRADMWRRTMQQMRVEQAHLMQADLMVLSMWTSELSRSPHVFAEEWHLSPSRRLRALAKLQPRRYYRVHREDMWASGRGREEEEEGEEGGKGKGGKEGEEEGKEGKEEEEWDDDCLSAPVVPWTPADRCKMVKQLQSLYKSTCAQCLTTTPPTLPTLTDHHLQLSKAADVSLTGKHNRLRRILCILGLERIPFVDMVYMAGLFEPVASLGDWLTEFPTALYPEWIINYSDKKRTLTFQLPWYMVWAINISLSDLGGDMYPTTSRNRLRRISLEVEGTLDVTPILQTIRLPYTLWSVHPGTIHLYMVYHSSWVNHLRKLTEAGLNVLRLTVSTPQGPDEWNTVMTKTHEELAPLIAPATCAT